VASVQSELRTRAVDLILGTAGQVGYTVAAGRFREAAPEDELHSAERAVTVRMRSRAPVNGYNNPQCGQGLYLTTMEVLVTYVVAKGEASYEAPGEQSGGADDETVEDRAADDAQVLLAVLGYQPNWTGTSPVVIDPYAVVPSEPPAPTLDVTDSRATLTLTLYVLTRADQYTAYGPTIT